MVKLDQENREAYMNNIIDTIKAENIEKFREYFLDLHPTDQLEVFVVLSEEQRKRVYHYLSPEEFAEIFQGFDLEQQKQYIQELDHSFAVQMFNEMYADDVADFLGELSEETADHFLQKMGEKDAQDVKDLLAYPDESAGAIMTTEFISISIKATVSDVMDLLRQEGPDAETIYYLYVVNQQHKLVGVVSLRDLIVSDRDRKIEEIMSTRVVSVNGSDDQEHVAYVIQKYDLLAVPVVSKQGKFVGIVTVDDVMDVVQEETTEDIGELTATRGATDLNLSSFQAARKRAPWIIVLMFLGLITAGVIGQFEETLESVALLAVFIPLIMDSAGNTGTQSLAVVVRGLALGTIERAGLGRLLTRELGTGFLMGLICSVVIIALIAFIYQDPVLGFIVGVSLFFALSLASVVGAIIPLIINKLKIDPAVASGPFITTLNDIIGLLIYFSVATSLLEYL